MKVHLKCFATLAQKDTCDYSDATPYDLPAGQTVKNLLKRVGVARDAVKVAFVNNRIVGMDQVLNEGDRVALTPAVGGM